MPMDGSLGGYKGETPPCHWVVTYESLLTGYAFEGCFQLYSFFPTYKNSGNLNS